MGVQIERIQVMRGNSVRWTKLNFPLRSGEFGYETDTGYLKIGDGITPWNDLPYYVNQNEVAAMIQAAIENVEAGVEDPRIGALTDLSTTVKTTVVDAINEINLPTVPYSLLYANAKA